MSNNNVYKVSNPLRILDALWDMIKCEPDLSKVLIFLPSRRAIRVFEKKIVAERGHAVILPYLIPLGSGVEEIGEDQEDEDEIVVSNQERVITLACLLTQTGFSINEVLFLAHDFIRMQDYIENQNKDLKLTGVDWKSTIGEDQEYFFKKKAILLDTIKHVMEDPKKKTLAEKQKEEIKEWVSRLDRYNQVIVCGSTASVPITAELMTEIAKRDNGRIILSGYIDGRKEDFELETNPYHSEYEFLKRLEMDVKDVRVINMGKNENLEFLNTAFGNTGKHMENHNMDKFKLIECPRESLEAKAVAYIAEQAIKQNKSVLVITPDAAGNQRIKNEFDALGLSADFSVGTPGNMTNTGRAILNLFDRWTNEAEDEFNELFTKANNDIYAMLVDYVDSQPEYVFKPRIKIDDEDEAPIWKSIKTMSDVLKSKISLLEQNGKPLTLIDIRGLVADAIGSVSVRQKLNDDSKIRVLGMVESRMQNADVVILTGLNDGMFPSKGYENAWLPRDVSLAIGLPSSNKKVSLMALDFINLSCANEVYWLRTTQSDSASNLESRFLSRVAITHGQELERDKDILKEIEKQDIVPDNPFKYSAPCLPIGKMNLHITGVEKLLKNPYEFYVNVILGLRIESDYWVLKNKLSFGNAVHAAIQNAIQNTQNMSEQSLKDNIRQNLVADNQGKISENSALFYFWNKRIEEIAKYLAKEGTYLLSGASEIDGSVQIPECGVSVNAKADVIVGDIVLDIKTGKAPTDAQLKDGSKPQIPFEGYILQNGGYSIKMKNNTQTPKLQILKLKRGELQICNYEGEEAQEMIDAAYDKVKEMITEYQKPDAVYEFKDVQTSRSPSPEEIRLKHFAKFEG